jgi:hypothetical protein
LRSVELSASAFVSWLTRLSSSKTTSGNEPDVPLKTVKRKECRLIGDTVTHTPTGKWFSAHPGMPDIYLESMVDVTDYNECEIRQMAALLLADRLKSKGDN